MGFGILVHQGLNLEQQINKNYHADYNSNDRTHYNRIYHDWYLFSPGCPVLPGQAGTLTQKLPLLTSSELDHINRQLLDLIL